MNFDMRLDPFLVQVIEASDGILCVFNLINGHGRVWLHDDTLPKDATEEDVRRTCAIWCSKLLNRWRQSFDARYCEEVPPTGKS